jgi:AraC-like DNA-binding protein/mannose-6-phosphate isomerase-like protein (cupin superfamily)
MSHRAHFFRDCPEMTIDPLSEILSFLTPETYVAGGYDLGGDWAVEFSVHSGIKYFALVSGAALVLVDGEAECVSLQAGDCVLLPYGRRFVITKNMAVEPIAFEEIRQSDWSGGIASVNGGGDAMLLGGHFAFSDRQADMLLGTMPPIIRLRDESDKLGLRWALDRMRLELAGTQPGSGMVVRHLAHLLLVQALRLLLEQRGERSKGWLFALADPRIAAAISAMHREPGFRWTLPLLAQRAGMSRSKFATRFKEVAGHSPIDYLIRWRMLLAQERLIKGQERIGTIAMSLGYESEAAFSTAFKRVMGAPPRKSFVKPRTLVEQR